MAGVNSAEGQLFLAQNQRYLLARISLVRKMLRQRLAGLARPAGAGSELPELPELKAEVAAAAAALDWPAPLDVLAARLELTSFEVEVLLLCAGVALSAELSAECAAASGGAQPTFELALAALSDGHWNAMTPAAPLRRYSLIRMESDEVVTRAPLRIEERVLHHLIGLKYLEPQLDGLLREEAPPSALCPSLKAMSEQVAAWLQRWRSGEATAPSHILHLHGEDQSAQLELAAAAAADVGLNALVLTARELPRSAHERSMIARLCLRECALAGALLIISCESGLSAEDRHAVAQLATSLEGPVLLLGAKQPLPTLEHIPRSFVPSPSLEEQRQLWLAALGPLGATCEPMIDKLLGHFRLGPVAIRTIAQSVRAQASPAPGPAHDAEPAGRLWQSCREYARGRIDELALRIDAVASWDELVLPAAQLETLKAIAGQVRQRIQVYERWGLGRAGQRGLGISALFSGTSGTGKTLAAEVLASELQLDLYRIDLSQVVSKYIGETEKNLSQVFDAAEQGGAILLFDEADALFGKRTEISDSHDRYANIEVSYLLARMESYRGLAILTTNLKGSLDSAFLRRIRFVVQFPFPDRGQRQELWRRAIHPEVPTESIDMNRLGQLSVAGGNIRNIALNAAFLAADAGEPLRMQHLLRAARSEYAKLERTLTDGEVAGWL